MRHDSHIFQLGLPLILSCSSPIPEPGGAILPGLLDSDGPGVLTIEGDFEVAFSAAFAGQPDGMIPPTRVKEYFPGRVTYATAEGRVVIPPADEDPVPADGEKAAVSIKVRGNSSLQECPFPKLKLKVHKSYRGGTAFERTKKIKIGTHCADDAAPGNIGRLRHQKATWREAFVFALLEELEIVSQRAKPISIEYVDTSTDETTERKAFVFEHQNVLAARMGGQAMEDPQETYEGDPLEQMNQQTLARIHLFHSLIGNWDWELGTLERGVAVWNTDVLIMPDGQQIPLPADFDLASIVTGAEIRERDIPPDVLPDEPNLHVRQAAHFLSWKLGTLLSSDELAVAKQHFIDHKVAIRARLEEALLGDEGRDLARTHIDAFFRALELL
ncbi:hypothetical protein ACFL6C_08425 [Myxococcota bacterium]